MLKLVQRFKLGDECCHSEILMLKLLQKTRKLLSIEDETLGYLPYLRLKIYSSIRYCLGVDPDIFAGEGSGQDIIFL